MTEALENGLTRFWDWLDNRGVIRRVVLGVAIWMTWEVSAWSMVRGGERTSWTGDCGNHRGRNCPGRGVRRVRIQSLPRFEGDMIPPHIARN